MIIIKLIHKSLRISVVFLFSIIKKIRRFEPEFEIFSPIFFNAKSFILWKLKVFNPLFNLDPNFNQNVASSVEIDIFIPFAEKYVSTLGQVIAGIDKNIKHPINKIFLVGNHAQAIANLKSTHQIKFIDENKILDFNKERIKHNYQNIDRSGWLFQQFLKLSADQVCEKENILIVDADTYFPKPKIFFHKNKMIIDQSEERHEPYHVAYDKILKKKSTSKLSFITHYMLFNKTFLGEMKKEIEMLHAGTPWHEVILNNIQYDNLSGFSEYELYGNYIFENHRKEIETAYWFNQNYRVVKHPKFIKSISLQ